MKRYAIVRNARERRQVEAYLPGNYEVIHEAWQQGEVFSSTSPTGTEPTGAPELVFVIGGTDSHGWGLDTYVIPRYASGLIWAEEIDLSHPIMKQIVEVEG